MTYREFSVDQVVKVRSAFSGVVADAIVIRQSKQRVVVRYVETGRTSEISVTRIVAKVGAR